MSPSAAGSAAHLSQQNDQIFSQLYCTRAVGNVDDCVTRESGRYDCLGENGSPSRSHHCRKLLKPDLALSYRFLLARCQCGDTSLRSAFDNSLRSTGAFHDLSKASYHPASRPCHQRGDWRKTSISDSPKAIAAIKPAAGAAKTFEEIGALSSALLALNSGR